MSQNVGWVKLHRKILDNPVTKNPHYRAVWIELLLRAAYEPTRTYFGGEEITLNPGQLVIGRKKMAEWTGVSESSVTRALKALANRTTIEQRSNNQSTLITIRNWTSYQEAEQKPHADRTLFEEERIKNKEFDTNKNTSYEVFQGEPENFEESGLKKDSNFKEESESPPPSSAAPPPQYGNKEVNAMLAALKNTIGIEDFADAQRWQRIYAKHLYDLLAKIGKEEFSFRLRKILEDCFKRKNCNKIRYVYEQVKGFIPDDSEGLSVI